MSVSLQVSIGEAIDKLTILAIKCKKIQDERLLDVKKEYEYLYEMLKMYVDTYKYYYNLLYKTNLEIWDVQDQIREEQIQEKERDRYYKQIVDLNDSRFLIKKKLNVLCESSFKEQKGYKLRKLFLVMHLGLGDACTMIGAIRYFSLFYDQVEIGSKQKNLANVRSMFSDDSSIIVHPIPNDWSGEYFTYIQLVNRQEYDVINTGICHPHIKDKITHPFFQHRKKRNTKHFLYQFYENSRLDQSIYSSHFYIPPSSKSKELYARTQPLKVVFHHDQASDGIVFIPGVDSYISNNDYLVLNPNRNVYPPRNPRYVFAQMFVGHAFLDYIDCIQNAYAIYVTDSSFFACMLPMAEKGDLNAAVLVCKPRSYDYQTHGIGARFTYLTDT
jgi:hypothetical protein